MLPNVCTWKQEMVYVKKTLQKNFSPNELKRACARAEYEINGECCPMCAPGLHLRKKKTCTRLADTICEPLEGFYCIDREKDSCRFAVKHSECHPGQYVKQTGTAFSDTVCGNCTVGTYSNGSFTACLPYSNCEIKGLTEIKPGTMSSDVECGKSVPIGMIVGVIVGLAVALATAVGIKIYCKFKHKKQDSDRSINYSVPIPVSDDQCEPYKYKRLIVTVNRCEAMGLTEIKAGTTSSDAECQEATSIGLIVGVTITGLVAVIMALIALIMYRKHKAQHSDKSVSYTPQQATEDDESVSLTHHNKQLRMMNRCSARNKIETEHGSSVKDVTCSPKGRERYGFIFAVVLAAAFYIILCCAPLSTIVQLGMKQRQTMAVLLKMSHAHRKDGKDMVSYLQ
ncbi:tumor necrosis factor receptor superfamily member 5-like isoform X1 [Labeo rohita]|uniref:Tumor necrosis factor receptor superfamily member 5-like isoform X1 n=1 Tax=Labeo rohita TaxID=84645 RepID=A0A498NFQ7_LABRO|nr:tumor necrosis factor receptor superfamily member 5-like isoform X1 [Labeo rohita]